MEKLFRAKKTFLKLVSSVITGTHVPSCPEDEYREVFNLAKRNNVQTILYNALGSEDLAEDIKESLSKNMKLDLFRDQSQLREIETIRNDFSENGIDFILLKGSHLKSLYPSPELRFMVDMDILVRDGDLDRAKDIVLSHGLKQEMNNGKDIVFIQPPCLTIELHRSLFTEENDFYEYFTGVWDRAVKPGGNEYAMSDNDLYVYVLSHMCEHYLDGSSCFRPCMDLYLLQKKCSLDFEYINEQFKTLGIGKFAENMRQLCVAMFEGKEENEILSMMENYIVLGPPVKNASVAAQNIGKDESKAQKAVHTLFPGLAHMKKRYPLLAKLPFLLPLFWLVRILQFAAKKDNSDSIEKKKAKISAVSKEDSDIMADIFRKSGL
ncbi:MAG: nucleotidyltransferase family protein [Clostridiales bacterium]|nr:nucleotidyltransferase family protein [Clostridiales bacterium]